MNELTFGCPSCGQHIQCEKAYGGHIIHCPGCSAALRIPFTECAMPGELSVTKAELVMETSAPAASGSAAAATDVHCRCPVCRSELRVPVAGVTAGSEMVTASLVRPPEAPAEPPPAAVPEIAPAAETAPAPVVKPGAEREQQIAAAREAHQVSANPPMKPRLSYILNGERPPPVTSNTEAPREGHENSHAE